MKNFLEGFRSAPWRTLAGLQERRAPWFVLVALCVGLVALAHGLFQHYLFMRPCEQCVYIRFAFLVMTLGGLIAAIQPRRVVPRVAGYLVAGWGAWLGLGFSLKLDRIHTAAHGDNPFGVQGCSTEPTFPFGLPLDRWSPTLFKPTGDCGFDNPIIPEGAHLDAVQQALTSFYGDGWYVWPPRHLGTMAESMIAAFGLALLLLAVGVAAWAVVAIRERASGAPARDLSPEKAQPSR